MANNIEVILSGKDAGFTDTLNKAAATLSSKNAEMINSLSGVAKTLGATGAAASEAGAAVSESASKYDDLSAAAKQFAAAQALARTQIKELGSAIKSGSVDAVEGRAAILELQAAVRTVGAQYSAASRAVASGATEIVGAHGRMSNSGLLMMHSVRSAADSFAAGLPPMMIFAEQLGRVGEAAALSGGGTGALGRLGAFMAGPWGIAVVGGVAVLGTIIAKMDLFSNAAKEAGDKLREQAADADIARQAQERFDLSLDGLIAKERKLTEELDKQLQTRRELDRNRATSASADAGNLIGQRDNAKVALDKAIEQQRNADYALQHPVPGLDPSGAAIAAARAAQAVADARARYEKANEAAMSAEITARKALIPVLQDQAKAVNDPKLAQKNKLEDQQRSLDKQRELGTITEQAYVAQWAKLQAQIDALSEKSRTRGESALNGMEALLRQLFPGVRITSTTGGKHVDGSEHYTGNAIDFVPKGGMGQYSKAEVEQMLEDAGVKFSYGTHGVKQFFGPGDAGHSNHFHIGFKGAPTPESAERAAEEAVRKRQAEQDRATRRAKEYADLTDNLDKQILDAKKSQSTDIEDIASYAIKELEVAKAKYTSDVVAKELTGDLTIAQGNELLAKEAILTNLKEQQVLAEKKYQLEVQDLRIWQAANDNTREVLQLQEQMAITQDERRKIQLQLLTAEKEQARREAQAVLDNPKAKPEEIARAKGTLSNLDLVYGLKEEGVRRATQSPLDAYVRENDPRLIGEKVQTLVVGELESVRRGIDDAISGALGIQDPFLKGLIDLFIQTVLIDPISKALQAHMGSGGGFFGGLLSGAASILGGGDGGLASLGADIAANPDVSGIAPIPGFASGTDFAPGGLALVGEMGPELLRLPRGAGVMPAPQTTSMLDRMAEARNDNGGGDAFHFHFPNVSNARDARETADQAYRRFRQHRATMARVAG